MAYWLQSAEKKIHLSGLYSFIYYEHDNTYYFPGEDHNFWEMVYVEKGEISVVVGKNVYTLNQGEIIFHKPNEFHTLKANNETVSNVFVISFVCSSKNMNIFKDKIITIPSKLKKYIAGIIEEYNHTFKNMSVDDKKLQIKENEIPGGQQMIRTYLEQLLIMLIRNKEEITHTDSYTSDIISENPLVSQIINIIEKNIYNRIYVEDICTELNFSRTYLSKIFKTSTGKTILEYILTRKIQIAKKMIREEKYNFTQISNMLCFDNPHYFSSVFKRITAMSPGDYRKSVLDI